MIKEIQVLHTIFQLELKPPFRVEQSKIFFGVFGDDIFNKHSEKIGRYGDEKQIQLEIENSSEILRKVKQVFSVDKLSNEDVYRIAKQFFIWIRDKFPDDLERVRIFNDGSREFVEYYFYSDPIIPDDFFKRE